MRTERNSANSLRVNYDRIREYERLIEAEMRKIAELEGGSATLANDKKILAVEMRIARLNQKINNETAKGFESGR